MYKLILENFLKNLHFTYASRDKKVKLSEIKDYEMFKLTGVEVLCFKISKTVNDYYLCFSLKTLKLAFFSKDMEVHRVINIFGKYCND